MYRVLFGFLVHVMLQRLVCNLPGVSQYAKVEAKTVLYSTHTQWVVSTDSALDWSGHSPALDWSGHSPLLTGGQYRSREFVSQFHTDSDYWFL